MCARPECECDVLSVSVSVWSDSDSVAFGISSPGPTTSVFPVSP